jgi:hypothetical protein
LNEDLHCAKGSQGWHFLVEASILGSNGIRGVVMKMGVFMLALFVCLGVVSVQAETLQYEPKVVRLVGTLVSGTGETPDEVRVSFPAIRLKVPVRIEADPDDSTNEKEEDVSLMQLILGPPLMKQFKKLRGQQVIVSGKLMHAMSGHHYTRVLVEVQGIEQN